MRDITQGAAVSKLPLLVLSRALSDIRTMSANVAEEIVTYWLVPAEPARQYFAGLIAEFAQRFEAPVFEPHVTLYTANAEKEDAVAVLDRALVGAGPCCLKIAGIGHSEKFTKTLFVQFDPDESVSTLSAKIRSASAGHRDYELNPHLSLIYKTIAAEQKAQIAAGLSVPFADVTFDSVKAVLSPAKIESRQDVEAWRVVAHQKLQ
jgi:hypothetical protein